MVLEGFTDVTPLLRAGVYALARRGTVIYIGKSKSLYARIYAHRNLANRAQRGYKVPTWFPASLKGIVFDEVHIRPCRLEDLDSLEAQLINLFKPKFNLAVKNQTPVRLPHALTIAGIVLQPNAAPRPQITRRL